MKPRVCLWRTIRDVLAKEIAEHSSKAGGRFYSLKDVCRRFKVSVITARRVFEELDKDGWIVSRPFKGTFLKKRAQPLQLTLFVPDQFLPFISIERVGVGALEIDIIKGALTAAKDAGVEIWIQPISSCTDTLQGQNLIFFSQFVGAIWPERLRKHNRVVGVHVSSSIPRIITVRPDIGAGARLATRHLTRLGHRRIALITHDIASPWLSGRFDGYARGLKSADIPWDWDLVAETFSDEQDVVWHAMDRLLCLPRPPTAMFVTNDVKALHVLSYCREKRIRVPKDMSIVGFDNIAGSAHSTPPLTTVDTQRQRLGRLAVELILKKPGVPAPEKDFLVRPILVPRGSTARCRARGQ